MAIRTRRKYADFTPSEKARHKANAKRYYQKNRDKIYESTRRWRAKNKIKVRKNARKYWVRWYAKNRASQIIKSKAYLKDRIARDPEYANTIDLIRRRWYYSPAGQSWYKRYRKKTRVKQRAFNRSWQERNPHKIAAHKAVRAALKNGTLVKGPCARCTYVVGKVEAHHNDYTKPLDVTWLCRRCHVIVHPHHKNPVAKK